MVAGASVGVCRCRGEMDRGAIAGVTVAEVAVATLKHRVSVGLSNYHLMNPNSIRFEGPCSVFWNLATRLETGGFDVIWRQTRPKLDSIISCSGF